MVFQKTPRSTLSREEGCKGGGARNDGPQNFVIIARFYHVECGTYGRGEKEIRNVG